MKLMIEQYGKTILEKENYDTGIHFWLKSESWSWVQHFPYGDKLSIGLHFDNVYIFEEKDGRIWIRDIPEAIYNSWKQIYPILQEDKNIANIEAMFATV